MAKDWGHAVLLLLAVALLLGGCGAGQPPPSPTVPGSVSSGDMERIRQIGAAQDLNALLPTWLPESLVLTSASSIEAYSRPGLGLVYEGPNRERLTFLELPGAIVPRMELSRDDRVIVRGTTGHYWADIDGYILPLFWWYEDGMAILITYQGIGDETVLRIAEGMQPLSEE